MNDPKISGPFFQPWIGSRYKEGYISGVRLLILGESHYGPGPAKRNLTRQLTEDYSRGRWSHRYWTNIMQLIEGVPHAEIDRFAFWSRVSFYNYVQTYAGDYWGISPSDQMWQAAEGPFFAVLDHLRPTHVLAISGRLWDNLSEKGKRGPALGGTPQSHETWYYPVRGAKDALTTWVPHASRISPRVWNPFVRAFLGAA